MNIDHVATLREARHGIYPEPVFAGLLAQAAGADSIVAHLREDRRHIKDDDLYILKRAIKVKFNLEMSCSKEIVRIACKVKPDQATLVPEKRQELTTEGGLDVTAKLNKIKNTVNTLRNAGITVSLFIDPDKLQILASRKAGVEMIELHTGRFADAKSNVQKKKYFEELKKAVEFGKEIGLIVNAGHGLNYSNSPQIAQISGIAELNIGHSIVCRAVLVGMSQAVREMKELIK